MGVLSWEPASPAKISPSERYDCAAHVDVAVMDSYTHGKRRFR